MSAQVCTAHEWEPVALERDRAAGGPPLGRLTEECRICGATQTRRIDEMEAQPLMGYLREHPPLIRVPEVTL